MALDFEIWDAQFWSEDFLRKMVPRRVGRCTTRSPSRKPALSEVERASAAPQVLAENNRRSAHNRNREEER